MGIRQIEVADQNLTIHENEDVHDCVTGRPLTGAWIWNSALVFSHWLATNNFDFRGKTVLELGAGAGLPGLTAALLGASRVILTDVAPLLPILQKNVEANGLEDRVEVRELVWGSEELLKQIYIGESVGFDVVLMSDVFFDMEEVAALGKTLRGLLYGEEAKVWAASEVRFWTGDCVDELVKQGFAVAVEQLISGVDGDKSEVDNDGGEMYAVYTLIRNEDYRC